MSDLDFLLFPDGHGDAKKSRRAKTTVFPRGFERTRLLPEYSWEIHGARSFTARSRFSTFAKTENPGFFTLALLYKREVKNGNSQVVMICRGLYYSLGKTKEWHCRNFKEEMENRASIDKRTQRWIFLVAPEGPKSVQIAQLLVFPASK